MPIIGVGASQAQQVRYVASGISLASGSTYNLGVPTRAGDVIVFSYTNAGAAPTLTSSTTGITWATNYKTTGGGAPQPTILMGYNANAGLTSFTVSGTTAAGGSYTILLISGLRSSSNPVITTTQAIWTTNFGGTTAAMNLSGNTNVLIIGSASQFGASSINTGTTSTSTGEAINQRATNLVTRSLATLSSENVSGSASETITLNWNTSATGGLMVLALAHA
jgi:hypothetical protein